MVLPDQNRHDNSGAKFAILEIDFAQSAFFSEPKPLVNISGPGIFRTHVKPQPICIQWAKCFHEDQFQEFAAIALVPISDCQSVELD